jgi:Family of unknown function (DUF5343)
MQEQSRSERKAPYAPVSALREFFTKIQNATPPPKVDRLYLQKLGVASNNEWALLSSLKFLGVVDAHGNPTLAYRRLQTTEGFKAALRDLVGRAYDPLFEVGGLTKSEEALVDYFRITSSASQAKNAARFFREVCALAEVADVNGIGTQHENKLEVAFGSPEHVVPLRAEPNEPATSDPLRAGSTQIRLAKCALLQKLPDCRPEWSAGEFETICRHFVEMVRSLDSSR